MSMSNLTEQERRTVRLNSLGNISNDPAASPMQPGSIRSDAVRGSFIPAKDPKVKKMRTDPKRGSYMVVDDKGEEESQDTIDIVPFVEEEHKK